MKLKSYEFTGVTLAGEDGHWAEAHKFILDGTGGELVAWLV